MDVNADKETIPREIIKRLPDARTFLKEADEKIGKTIFVGKELIYNEIIRRLENKAFLLKEIDERTGRDIICREIKRKLPNRDSWKELKPICGSIISNLAYGDEVARIVSKKMGVKVIYVIPSLSELQETYLFSAFNSKRMNHEEKIRMIEGFLSDRYGRQGVGGFGEVRRVQEAERLPATRRESEQFLDSNHGEGSRDKEDLDKAKSM